jgi:hypothetical protein
MESLRHPEVIMEHAKEFISEQLEIVKEVIGLSSSEEYPQSSIKHNTEYLNDIANGRWRALRHVETKDKTNLYFPDWSWDKWFSKQPLNLEPLWNSIKTGVKLKPTKDIHDRSNPCIEKGIKVKFDPHFRKNMLNEIRNFNLTKLKKSTTNDKSAPFMGDWKAKNVESTSFMSELAHAKDVLVHSVEEILPLWAHDTPQAETPHLHAYLGDIAKGKWEPLRHTKTIDKTDISKWDWSGFKSKKSKSKSPLWNNIKAGHKLRHVHTVDKSKPVIEKGSVIKQTIQQRRKLLEDIRQFKMKSKVVAKQNADKEKHVQEVLPPSKVAAGQ